MKKKIFIGIAMSLFAVATVFNMNISEQNKASDISLNAIEIMAQAEAESSSCPNGCLTTKGNGCYCTMWFPNKKEYNW